MTFTCDVNSANIHFLREQGKIISKEAGGFIFNHYEGKTSNRNGWLLPGEYNPDNITLLKDYISNLLNLDKTPNFVLLSDEQKDAVAACVEQHFPDKKISFKSDEGDSDYIYCVHKMAELPGKDFQKKRNHVSRFKRNFGDDWQFKFYTNGLACHADGEKVFSHISEIYNQWRDSRSQGEDEFLLAEEKSLNVAVKYFERLKLIAGILYVQNKPAAFLIASFTTEECLNAHFEKCVEEFSKEGALAVLNQQFAQNVLEIFPGVKYLNREEDLNIPGLRKSKLSYQPEFLITKSYGQLI